MTAGIERIVLKRVSADLAFADVRLPGVNLTGLRVEKDIAGLRITPPTRADRQGREWPIYALQPGTREAVEASIREAWSRSGQAPSGERP